MSKKSREAIRSNLAQAISPPTPQRRRSAHLDGLLDEYAPPEAGQSAPDPGVVRPPLSTPGGQTTPPPSAAPSKDFNRRANSLERDALPAGHFPGTSKRLYDSLYLRTRGAIAPKRTILATKRDLAEWAGIKNRKTIDAHMRYFELTGLVTRQWQPGQNEGYLYEVFLPEEVGLIDRPPQVVRPLDPSDQISVRGTDQKLGSGGQTQVALDADTSGGPKTSFKTKEENLDDDAALAGLNATLKSVAEEVTGRKSSGAEADRWRELAEVLAAELRIAAARTTVSSAPSFLAEHLRRRLWKIDKKQAQAEGRELPDQAPSQPPAVDAKACPDCGGSGWWYPEGPERGVKKCKHEKLNQEGT